MKPVQGGYLMEYNYAGRSWPARSVLISDTGGSNSVQYESKPESGLVIKGVSEELNYSVYLFIYFLHRDIRTTEV